MIKSVKTFALLILGLLVFSSMALSQTKSAVPEIPCGEVSPRPTLKEPVNLNSSTSASSKPCGTQNSSKSSSSLLKIRFEGLQKDTRFEALRFFAERNIQLPRDSMPDADLLARAVQALKEFLENRGYPKAMVDANRNEEEKTITFLVYQGPRANISEIRFQGNQIFSSQELLSRLKEYLVNYEPLETSYNPELLDYGLRLLANFVRSEGYLQARIGEPKKEAGERGLVISIPVDEGPLYRLGKIKISGADHISPEQIRAMLSLQAGDVAQGDLIGKWLYEDVKDLYGSKGFVQYTAEPEPEFRAIDKNQLEGIVDFKVSIEEGQQFRVRSILLLPNSPAKRDFRGLTTIRPGDIYDHRLLGKNISQLNEIGWFQKIDQEKDVEFRTDRETALLDIVIKVNLLESEGTRRR